MPYYTKLGEITRHRHIQFRRPDGALYSEEVFGTEGFDGPTSTLYHIHPPTQVSGWKVLHSTKTEFVEQNIMRMMHLKTAPMQAEGDAVDGRRVILGNADVEMSVCQPASQMAYHYKNGQGDECYFVHYGSGVVHTTFGTLRFGPKDYIILPKGTIYKIEFNPLADADRPEGISAAAMPLGKFVLFETMNTSHFGPPKRYISKKTAQFLEHAPYCERDLRVPKMPMTFDERGEFEVRIKARDCIHSYVYSYHPLDVVGWDGCYYPYCFNIDDFAPIVGKVHMPPPIHQTFEGHNFVICSFCPRVLDFHPEAIPIPYNHSNIDSDEVLYYVEGNYKARRGIESGSVSLHPQGIAHGPHPGTVEASLGKKYTDELAVMCDTFRPLFPTKYALGIDDPAYPESWRTDHHAPGEARAGGTQGKGEGPVNTWT